MIATAGTDEKVAYLKELGVDHAFNYKTSDLEAELTRFGDLDVYWDHVGGPILDETLPHMKDGGVVVVRVRSAFDGKN